MTSKICGRDVGDAMPQTRSTRGTEAAPAKDQSSAQAFTDAVIIVIMVQMYPNVVDLFVK